MNYVLFYFSTEYYILCRAAKTGTSHLWWSMEWRFWRQRRFISISKPRGMRGEPRLRTAATDGGRFSFRRC